jgi:chromosome segregation ATPase
LALLLLARPASAQSGNSERLSSIEESLIGSLEASARLRQALAEQRTSREDLETAYAELALQLRLSSESARSRIEELARLLNDSLTRSADLEAETSRLTALLTVSSEESRKLSLAFDSYRAEMQGQVRGLERRVLVWKVAAVSAWIVALAATIWAAVK